MIEEFRAVVVDAVVLKLAFGGTISPTDFEYDPQGDRACLMNEKARAILIRSLEEKLNSPVRHPVSHFKLDYRRCIEHQIDHLAAVIRGLEPSYRPVLLR